MIHILYLAAGNSSRFGGNKLMADFHGKPVYAWGLDVLTEVLERRPDCSLTLISRTPEILRAGETRGLHTVNSPLSRLGLSYTIRTGIEALGQLRPEDWLLFVPADQPALRTETVEKLLSCTGCGCLGASAACRGEPGSPALFSAALVPELLALEGDRGGRSVLNRHASRICTVEAGSERELLDVDTEDDLRKLN